MRSIRVPQLWLKLVIWVTKHQARVLWNFCGKSSVLKFLYARFCRCLYFVASNHELAYRTLSVRNSAPSGRPVGDKKNKLKLNFLLFVRTFFVSKGKYQRNCRPVTPYLIFVSLTIGKITRYAQTDFALVVCYAYNYQNTTQWTGINLYLTGTDNIIYAIWISRIKILFNSQYIHAMILLKLG